MNNKQKAIQDELEFVSQRWSYLPASVRTAWVAIAGKYAPPKTFSFPTPEGATWDDVTIAFIGPEKIRVTVLGVVRTFTFATAGLANVRRPKKPRTEWRMMLTYAENPEPDAYYRLPKRSNLKMAISRFRHWLQTFFNIPGDPLKPFKGGGLWRPRFKIFVEEW